MQFGSDIFFSKLYDKVYYSNDLNTIQLNTRNIWALDQCSDDQGVWLSPSAYWTIKSWFWKVHHVMWLFKIQTTSLEYRCRLNNKPQPTGLFLTIWMSTLLRLLKQCFLDCAKQSLKSASIPIPHPPFKSKSFLFILSFFLPLLFILNYLFYMQ